MESRERDFYLYFAGCVDCDGWISRIDRKTTSSYVVGLTQHNQMHEGMTSITEDLSSFGYRFSYKERKAWDKKSNTVMENIVVKENESALRLLKNIEPFLRFKKAKDQEGIKYLSWKLDTLQRGTVKGPDKRKHWSAEEEQLLILLHSKGHSNSSMASKIGRSSVSIGSKLCKLGIRRG